MSDLLAFYLAWAFMEAGLLYFWIRSENRGMETQRKFFMVSYLVGAWIPLAVTLLHNAVQ